MKRFLKLLFLSSLVFTFNVKAVNNDVTVYIFRGHGCSHCYDALEYFYKNRKKADYSVVALDTWENEENYQFFNEFKNSIGDDSTGVPYIVIGNNYHKSGFGDAMIEEIENAIKEAREDENYIDLVKSNMTNDTLVEFEDLMTAAHKEYVYLNFWDYLITFVVVAALCTGGYLLYIKIKNSKNFQNK